MKSRAFSTLLLLTTACAISASTFAQQASPSPAPVEDTDDDAPRDPPPAPPPGRAIYPPKAVYPIPYEVPKPEKIKASLDLVHARLQAAVRMRIVDSRTREEITDLTQNVPTAVMDRGEEWKFQPLQYPMAVVYNGMLLASEVTGDSRYTEFVIPKFQFILDQKPTFAKWSGAGRPSARNPFIYFLEPDSLDAVGAMGAAMVKARRAKLGPDLKELIDMQAHHVSTGQFRLADGTLARKSPRADSVWADDLYMSVPLLAQMGALTGEARYFDDGAKQLLQIAGYLFRRDRGLWAHSLNTQNAEYHADYFWGRANGWCIMAAAELLETMPADHPRREEVLKLFRSHAKGLAERQSAHGLWHQLLDRTDSYLESSCTGMLTFALARGVNRGWLDPFSFGPVALAGWCGLSTKITEQGHIEGTCIGTNYGSDAVFYYNRPPADDVHGYGPLFLAGSEIIRLVQNENLRVRMGNHGQFVVDKRRAPREGGAGR